MRKVVSFSIFCYVTHLVVTFYFYLTQDFYKITSHDYLAASILVLRDTHVKNPMVCIPVFRKTLAKCADSMVKPVKGPFPLLILNFSQGPMPNWQFMTPPLGLVSLNPVPSMRRYTPQKGNRCNGIGTILLRL